ncbi:MAG: hypothetical protein Q9185_005651 [Variospora sp. 1 TL-2023]
MAAIARRQMPLRLPTLPQSYHTVQRRCIAAPEWLSRVARTPQLPLLQERGFKSSAALSEKKYTKEHEWIELSDDKTHGTIGITNYAASALGDVVYVELPTLDLEVSAGDSIGAVESVKSASDIMTPVGGKIVATNEKLEEKPGIINKGPEGEGWIARIHVGDAGEVEGLMGGEEYRKFTE